MMKEQRGVALMLVLVFLGVGALVLVPTLGYTASALKLFSVSRETAQVQYSLEATTAQAMWYLQYDTTLRDCDQPLDGTADDLFANCVAKYGSWKLATSGKTSGAFNETQIDTLNGQEVEISVEVPGGLTSPPEPTPTPAAGSCVFDYVERDPTWVQVGEAITYEVHVTNCSTSPASKNVRRFILRLPPEFDYVATSTDCCVDPSDTSLFDGWPGGNNKEPEVSRCDGPVTAPDPDYPGCKTNDNSLLLAWPDATGIFSGSKSVTLAGGSEKVLTFQAIPNGWGVFYVDASTCYFAANAGACDSEVSGDPVKNVAPVTVGMFNIKGNGKGNAFGASSKFDGSTSDLVSKNP